MEINLKIYIYIYMGSVIGYRFYQIFTFEQLIMQKTGSFVTKYVTLHTLTRIACIRYLIMPSL